jgi:hypothetical protein
VPQSDEHAVALMKDAAALGFEPAKMVLISKGLADY